MHVDHTDEISPLPPPPPSLPPPPPPPPPPLSPLLFKTFPTALIFRSHQVPHLALASIGGGEVREKKKRKIEICLLSFIPF